MRRATPQTRPAERLLASAGLDREASLIVAYLRDTAAQATWERDALASDLGTTTPSTTPELRAGIDRAEGEELRRVATALARAADRAAMASPNAVRRIERPSTSAWEPSTNQPRGSDDERPRRLGLEPEDDAFHPRTDDRWWTETWWNAWFVPERKMIGYFYPVFRHNIGVQFGGVVVYDDRGPSSGRCRCSTTTGTRRSPRASK